MKKVKTVVLIHGINTNNKYFENFKKFFEKNNYNVIAPNLPHKDNHQELAKMGIKDYLIFLENELEKIKEPFFIVGHSMGGLLTQILAEKGYGEKIVLLAPAPPSKISSINLKLLLDAWNIIWSILTFKRVFELSHNFSKKNIFNLKFSDDDVKKKKKEELKHDSLKVLKELTFGINTEVDKINKNVLIVAGDKDRMISPKVFEKIHKKYSGSELKFFKNRSHYILAEDGWEEVVEFILVWLEK